MVFAEGNIRTKQDRPEVNRRMSCFQPSGRAGWQIYKSKWPDRFLILAWNLESSVYHDGYLKPIFVVTLVSTKKRPKDASSGISLVIGVNIISNLEDVFDGTRLRHKAPCSFLRCGNISITAFWGRWRLCSRSLLMVCVISVEVFWGHQRDNTLLTQLCSPKGSLWSDQM